MSLYFRKHDPYYKQPTAHPRWRLLQWVNSTVSSHDAICDCDNALDHLFSLVYNCDAENFKPKLIEAATNTQKCLTSSDPIGEATGEGLRTEEGTDDVPDGALEELFAAADEPTEGTSG